MNKTAAAVLNALLSVGRTDKKHSRKAGVKTKHSIAYPQVVNFLSKIYATDEINAETESVIIRFAQGSGMMPSQFAKEMSTKSM